MRHRVYSKDAAERTVLQLQENTGKAAVVGRWAEDREETQERKQHGQLEREQERPE